MPVALATIDYAHDRDSFEAVLADDPSCSGPRPTVLGGHGMEGRAGRFYNETSARWAWHFLEDFLCAAFAPEPARPRSDSDPCPLDLSLRGRHGL